jgi:hypothetical protein
MNNVVVDEKMIKEIDTRMKINLEKYRKCMIMMSCDAPIGVLCLPKAIETILTKNGYLRIYDLFGLDFVEIKGLGESRIRDLTSALDQFFSMG